MLEIKNDKKNSFVEWLEVLQQESWQLELLISGFAIYGIWASQDLLHIFTNYLDVNSPSSGIGGKVISILTLMLRAGWAIFFINLLIHVVLRGLWIGAIGLRYVSGNIDYDELGFSDYFTNYFKDKIDDFDRYIERLEKICSVIFAYTFLLFFLFISLAFFIISLIITAQITDYFVGEQNKEIVITVIFTYFGLAIIVFIDFITLGGFKKIKNRIFSKIYMYLYRFFSIVTLSFIYRPLLYNFIDYKYTRRLFWFSFPYVFFITLLIPNFVLEAFPYFPDKENNYNQYNKESQYILAWNNYDDLREKNIAISGKERKRLGYISLSNYRIKGTHASLFLREISTDEELFSKKYSISPYRKSGLQNKVFGISETDSLIYKLKKKKKEALKKIYKKNKKLKKEKNQGFLDGVKVGMKGIKSTYEIDSVKKYWRKRIEEAKEKKIINIRNAFLDLNKISIDGKPFNKALSCRFYIHPNLQEKGLLCEFSVDSLSLGEHIMTLNRSRYNRVFRDSIEIRTLNLPFWILD